MNKLVPLSVPWAISPSMPNIKLLAEENGRTVVQFFALFGFELPGESEAAGQTVAIGTDGLRLDPTAKNARHQLISLTFKNVGWLLRSPQHSDREVINESLFDWSEVRGTIRPGEAIADWRERCLAEWSSTRIAPDPAAYVVANSDWKAPEAERWGLKHYLLLGDACSIEVLAQDVDWSSEGAVLGW